MRRANQDIRITKTFTSIQHKKAKCVVVGAVAWAVCSGIEKSIF
ncbi:hypothetical protein [Helicobacter cetorum]|nr:hypothetical protein [Helicobacter cetorum]